MKVLMLVIASQGGQYPRMKEALVGHYTANRPPWLDLKFVYGSNISSPGDFDLVYPQVGETLVPGMFNKTIVALEESSEYDFVIRTNLSTWFHWANLLSYLLSCKRLGLYAGCIPNGSLHVSGYCIIMSADVVGMLLTRAPRAPRSDLDDVEIAGLLSDVQPQWVPKVDVFNGHDLCLIRGGPKEPPHVTMELLKGLFVVRHKSRNRNLDAAFMEATCSQYASGAREVLGLLRGSCLLVKKSDKFNQRHEHMHFEARHFLDWCVRQLGPFENCKVLDVGSGDINGNNRHYFGPGCSYTGCDVAPGPNVDIVMPCHAIPYPHGSFDVIISSECLEHDMHWKQTVQKVCDLLRPGGVFMMTCASTGRAEHGTLRTTAGDSFSTRTGDTAWGNYYQNLTAQDIAGAIQVAQVFPLHKFYYQPFSKDLYFYGVKALPEYTLT